MRYIRFIAGNIWRRRKGLSRLELVEVGEVEGVSGVKYPHLNVNAHRTSWRQRRQAACYRQRLLASQRIKWRAPGIFCRLADQIIVFLEWSCLYWQQNQTVTGQNENIKLNRALRNQESSFILKKTAPSSATPTVDGAEWRCTPAPLWLWIIISISARCYGWAATKSPTIVRPTFRLAVDQ